MVDRQRLGWCEQSALSGVSETRSRSRMHARGGEGQQDGLALCLHLVKRASGLVVGVAKVKILGERRGRKEDERRLTSGVAHGNLVRPVRGNR